MKSILISIKPQFVEKILNGKKTIEIRKTMPKCELPCKVYIYETKGKGKFVNCGKKREKIGGKVVAEFTLNTVNEVEVFENVSVQYWNNYALEKSCLNDDEISNYIGKNKKGYFWYIDNLKIYDKPKELMQFSVCANCSNCYKFKLQNERFNNCNRCKEFRTITKAPQSWCYVVDKDI